MEPNLEPGPEQELSSGQGDDLSPGSVAKVVTAEHRAKNLLSDLQGVLRQKGVINEHHAKKLRKAWDTLREDSHAQSLDLKALEDGFDTLREKIHQQVDARNNGFSGVEELLQELEQSVKAGDLRLSQQLEQRIIQNLNKIKALSSQRRQKVIIALEALQPRIKKLVSWRKWGTVQAREQIIEEIRNLHHSEKSLEKIAKRIQQAREQWKEWDLSGEGGDNKLYQVFDKVCTEAYKPCKAQFEAQKKRRLAAGRQRANICESLEKQYDSIDWRNVDWRQIQQFLREHQSRWRKAGSPHFKDRKSLYQRFDTVLAKFNGPLDRERKRNLKQRQRLIADITQLAEVDDIRAAMNLLQKKKKEWQVSVSGDRKQEQALWKSFIEACDKVYQRSREEKKEYDKQLEGQFKEKQDLCQTIRRYLDNEAIDPAALTSQIKQWKSTWEQAGRVPKNQVQKIEKQFKQLIAKANKRLRDISQQQQSELDQRLFALAKVCTDTESKVLSDTEIDQAVVEQAWQAVEPLPDAIQERIRSRLEVALQASEDVALRNKLIASLEQNFQKINHLLLQLEIHCEVESPVEHAKQRMALQIRRLSAAMRKGTGQEMLNPAQFVNRIHTLGALAAEQQSQVTQRFTTCYEKLQHDRH